MNAMLQIGFSGPSGTTAKPAKTHNAGRLTVASVHDLASDLLLKDAFRSALPGI